MPKVSLFEIRLVYPSLPRARVADAVMCRVIAKDEAAAISCARERTLRGELCEAEVLSSRLASDEPVFVDTRSAPILKPRSVEAGTLSPSVGKPAAPPSPAAIAAKLTTPQKRVLECLRGSTFPRGGWTWGGAGQTVRILTALVRRNLAAQNGGIFNITPEGLEVLHELTLTDGPVIKKAGPHTPAK